MFLGKLFRGLMCKKRKKAEYGAITEVEEEFHLTPEFAQKLIDRAREMPQDEKPWGINKSYSNGNKQEEWLNNEANGYTIATYYSDASLKHISWSRHNVCRAPIGTRTHWGVTFYKNGQPSKFTTTVISGVGNDNRRIITEIDKKYAREGWVKNESVTTRPWLGWLYQHKIEKSYYPDGNIRHLFLIEKKRRYHVICYGNLTRHRLRYVMVTGEAPK